MIEVFSTESSNRITGMSYDTDKKELKVDYKRGGTYLYREVPEEVFMALKTAPSIGKAINSLLIKGGYSYNKLN